MLEECVDLPKIDDSIFCGTLSYEPNEQILRIMKNLGIDSERTKISLQVKNWSKTALNYLLRLSFTDKLLWPLHGFLFTIIREA